MELTRREFLKFSGTGLCASLAGLPAAAHASSGPAAEDVAILYDASKCIGCRACQMGCKRWNELPTESSDAQGLYESPQGLSHDTWTYIALSRQAEDDWHFINYQCMHCNDAACVSVCPSSALFKDERGFTAFDKDKCIGCGYCTKFCPYGVPHLRTENALTGEAKAAKCTFCQDRLWNGLGGPYCVESCPVGALKWGAMGELLPLAQARVETLQAQGLATARLYGQDQAGGLHRLTILFGEPERYGLPPRVASPATARFWQKIVQPLGEVAFAGAILGALTAFVLARRNIHMGEVE